MYLKNFKSDLDKLQKNQCSITYGLDKLNNEQDNLDNIIYRQDNICQQKSRVLLMVAIYYMRVKEIKY